MKLTWTLSTADAAARMHRCYGNEALPNGRASLFIRIDEHKLVGVERGSFRDYLC